MKNEIKKLTPLNKNPNTVFCLSPNHSPNLKFKQKSEIFDPRARIINKGSPEYNEKSIIRRAKTAVLNIEQFKKRYKTLLSKDSLFDKWKQQR